MLIQKIKIDTSPQYDPIEIDDFYLSPDLDFISGTTSYKHGLVTGSMVRYNAKHSTLFYESPLECQNVLRQGSVKYMGVFPVKRAVYYDRDIAYVEYGGKVYYVNDGSIVVDFEDYTYIVEGVNDETEDVKIPVTVYIENGVADIDGNKLAVDISYSFSGASDDSDAPLFKYNYMSTDVNEYNGESFDIDLWDIDDWKIVTKFILRPDDNILLDVSSKHIIRDHVYINVGSETYSFQTDEPMSISGAVYVDVAGYKIDVDDIVACNGVIDIHNVNLDYTFVELWDGSTVVPKSYHEESETGDSLAIVMTNPYDSMPIGSTVIAKSTYTDYIDVAVEKDTVSGKEYIVFDNSKYDIIKNDYVTVTINGKEYEFIYINDELSSGVIEIGEHVVPLRINGDIATRYFSSRFDDENGQYYDSERVSYEVKRYDAVIIEDEKYRVQRNNNMYATVTLTRQENYEFKVDSVSGTGIYYMSPILTVNTLSDVDTEKRRIDICTKVGSSEYGFVFYLKNTVFGNEKITFKKVFDDQMKDSPGMTPISSDDVVSPNIDEASLGYSDDFKNSFFMYKILDYYSIPLLLSNVAGTNIMQEDIIARGKLKSRIAESITPIVDMEKDVYFPVIANYDENGNYESGEMAKALEFNIHLRTRDLETWTVNENDENPFFANDSNWNITDCGAYRQYIERYGSDEEKLKKLMRSSDLMYFLKFTDEDVDRQKKKIEKTFLRLSFYNSPDAANQYLLGTSTIFLNEGNLYWKYFTNQNNGDFFDVGIGYRSNSIGVAMEPLLEGAMTLDDEKRLSSRFTVVDKNNTADSSEGFYIYMFKEYSTYTGGTIYMTVDLYHAGLGKKIPLYLPMTSDLERPLTFSQEDLQILKNGIPLNRYYEQLYIPLECKYDFGMKRYVYWLRKNYLFEEHPSDGTIVFNLFELKIGR